MQLQQATYSSLVTLSASCLPTLSVLPADAGGQWMRKITGDGTVWVPRNTIVRSVFNEVLRCSDGMSLAALASEPASSANAATTATPAGALSSPVAARARSGSPRKSVVPPRAAPIAVAPTACAPAALGAQARTRSSSPAKSLAQPRNPALQPTGAANLARTHAPAATAQASKPAALRPSSAAASHIPAGKTAAGHTATAQSDKENAPADNSALPAAAGKQATPARSSQAGADTPSKRRVFRIQM